MRNTRSFWAVVVSGLVLVATVAAATAAAAPAPGDCNNDSKSLGRYEVSSEYAEGTWWKLTSDGLAAAGHTTEAEQKAMIEAFFGTTFATLDDAVDAVIENVRLSDKNGNGYVCASSSRGTHQWFVNLFGDPNWAEYVFSVQDDKHA
jgi:hypothetical protein